MTKKRICIIVIIQIALILGFFLKNKNTIQAAEKGKLQTKSFGTFILPQELIEAKQWTRGEKYFYVKTNAKFGRTTTNISIEQGNNPYSIKDHETFRYAILHQLSLQTKKEQINGSGKFTDNNYTLYVFTIENINENPPIRTVQYYIIGEKKHILIHLTDFYDKDNINSEELALEMVNSFRWAK